MKTDSRRFLVSTENFPNLILTYKLFPEVIEIFNNIAKGKPVAMKVASKWDSKTLEEAAKLYILPVLVESGAIYVDKQTASGFATDYQNIEIEGMTYPEVALLASEKSKLISTKYINEKSTSEDTLVCNVEIVTLAPSQRREFFSEIRGVVRRYFNTEEQNQGGQDEKILLSFIATTIF